MAYAIPSKQTAVLFNTKDNTLSLTESAPTPSSTTAHVIKVHSTAITNGELTWAPFCPDWPTLHVPCYDVSGTIVSTVPDSKFSIGDKVYGRVNAYREGTARQYATLLPSETSLVPQGLDMTTAACVPMSALTAWQAVFEHGALSAVPYVSDAGDLVGGQARGKRVLVLGAAGGVGLMAVQFAKLAGAFVAGTAGPRNREFVQGLGVDEVVDYTTTSMETWVSGSEDKKFDLVFDCAGGKSMLDGWNAVKRDGVYVSVVPGFKEPDGGKPEGMRSAWFVMESRGEELEAISRFIEKGLVRTWVDSVWKIEEFEKAFAKTATGHARGKVVIKVGGDEA